MADKLKKNFNASHSFEASECIGKEAGQAAKSFQFLWPQLCMQSSCPSAPLRVQCPRDPGFKNHGEVSSKPRSSKSADAAPPGTKTGMHKDLNMPDLRMLKDSVSPYQDKLVSRKCKDGMDLHSVNTNLMPFVENKEQRPALDLDSRAEVFPSQLKKRKQFSLLDTDGSSQESMFQGEKVESGTWDYASRETSENERLLLEMKCLEVQLHELIAMQSHKNGLKAGIHIENESAYFDASVKVCVSGSADLVGPKYVGKLNTRAISCIDMKSDYSFATGVIKELATTSAPCHSMYRHDIQGCFRQRCKEDATSNGRVLDNFFDNGYVRATSACHMKAISAGGSMTIPSNLEFLRNNCTTEISNLATRSFDHQYASETEETTLCDSQRVPKFAAHMDPPDHTVLRPFKCSRVEHFFISEGNNGTNYLEQSCELQEKTLQYDWDKTSGSENAGNKPAASSPPNEGSRDVARRGVSTHETEKEVVFEGSDKENHTGSRSPKENSGQLNTDAESPDMSKEKMPSYSDSFLEGRKVEVLETNSLHGEDLLCHTKPRMSGSEEMAQTAATSEPSCRWVKRLQPCSMDSFALGTNSFSVDYYANNGQVQKLFTRVLNYSRSNSNIHFTKDTEQKKTGKSMAISVNDRDSPVELLKRSYPWIRRWCRTSQEHGHSRLASDAQLYSRRETQVPCQGGLDEEKQLPSIGALALMGKAATNFRPCEFRKRGPFTVWNTNGMLQE